MPEVENEFTTTCSLCPKIAISRSEEHLQRWGVWHVYYEHFDTWIAIAGDRPPNEPRPDEALLVVHDPTSGQ